MGRKLEFAEKRRIKIQDCSLFHGPAWPAAGGI